MFHYVGISLVVTSLSEKMNEDLAEMEKKLSMYVGKGRATGATAVREEPAILVKPDKSLIKTLKKLSRFDGRFLAVDCSTRTLKRANNWGIYLMRAAYSCVKERDVDWNYYERICTVVGDASVRRGFLQDFRIEMESHMALNLLASDAFKPYYVQGDVRSMYLLLDGGGYFGGDRKFRISLYEKCEADGINLLTISKNSPILHDDKGKDLIAATYMLSPQGSWIYHPVRKADKEESLYGDISIVKLSEDSQRIFRCDIMDYLTNREVNEVVSPLTAISEDPRCIGYPIVLWLAHEFSSPSDSMLLSHHDKVEETLAKSGLLEVLRREEFSCSFADELHGVRYAFEREWSGDYF
jgi:hypothetical protein